MWLKKELYLAQQIRVFNLSYQFKQASLKEIRGIRNDEAEKALSDGAHSE